MKGMSGLNSEEELKYILVNWELEDGLKIKEEDIDYETEREKHIWNIENRYILKMTKSKEEMINNITMSKMLLSEKIPVQGVLKTKENNFYVSLDNKYYGLFTRLQGEVIKDYFEGEYLDRAFYLGECLADLHNGLSKLTEAVKKNKDIFDNNMIEELNGWVKKEIDAYLPKCNLVEEEKDLFINNTKDLLNNFQKLYEKLPRQLIHRDFHGENMIFKDEKLVGYIDFDLSQINARVFDIGYFGTGSLSSVFSDEIKRKTWIEFFKEFIKGYESKNKLSEEKISSLKYMMIAIELIMIAFFISGGYSDIADLNIKMLNWIDSDLLIK